MNATALAPAARRQALERIAMHVAEQRRRVERQLHEERGYWAEDGTWQGGLMSFIRYFWDILEPGTPFVDGWAMAAICEHLEALTFGELNPPRLLINVPPGFSKSMIVDVFWPAWEWAAMDLSHLRYVAFSYSASLTERDNGRFRDLIMHPRFQAMYGQRLKLRKIGETKVTNTRHGWKLATSVGGLGTGERGDRVILDDPHNVKDSESEVVRTETVRWFRESMTSRLNNMETGSIVIIMQRVHENDVSGEILEHDLGYVHLMIPMRYVWSADDEGLPYATPIGWVDPRWQSNPEDCEGELAWPERFSEAVVSRMEKTLGPYASAGQLQQTPEARGGGIIKRSFWQPWEPVDGKFPAFDYVVASLDGAFTDKEENDPSAMTVWGVFDHHGYTRAMLITAWRKWLEFEGEKPDPDDLKPRKGESSRDAQERMQAKWGLVEHVYDTCNKWKVDRLLIEAKATGISVGQSLRKRYGRARWSTQLVEPAGDKVARALAQQSAFSQGMIYVPMPLRQWGALVVDEMAVFPKGRYRDLTDSATQAVKHLRDIGLLVDDEEQRAAKVDVVRHEPRKKVNPYAV